MSDSFQQATTLESHVASAIREPSPNLVPAINEPNIAVVSPWYTRRWGIALCSGGLFLLLLGILRPSYIYWDEDSRHISWIRVLIIACIGAALVFVLPCIKI